MERSEVSIVAPAYNEVESVPRLYEQLREIARAAATHAPVGVRVRRGRQP